MPFKDKQAKTDYQRGYMRRRRGSNTGSNTGSNEIGSNKQGLTASNVTPLLGLCIYCGLPADQPSPQCGRHPV